MLLLSRRELLVTIITQCSDNALISLAVVWEIEPLLGECKTVF